MCLNSQNSLSDVLKNVELKKFLSLGSDFFSKPDPKKRHQKDPGQKLEAEAGCLELKVTHITGHAPF